MHKPVLIGITGGLASGKSTVMGMFKKLGAQTFDADRIAHWALYRNTYVYKMLVKTFGKSILGPRLAIVRKKLARIAFSNKKNQRELCRLVHPWVFEYIDKKVKKNYRSKNTKVIIIEAVLLIESGLFRKMDATIVVKSNIKQQLARARQSRNMTTEGAKKRMEYQMPLTQKIKYADFVIDNRGTFKNTLVQVKRAWKQIKTKY